MIKILNVTPAGDIEYRLWWVEDTESRLMEEGDQILRRRSPISFTTTYADLFPDGVVYRKISLAQPHCYKIGKAQHTGRTVLWSAGEA